MRALPIMKPAAVLALIVLASMGGMPSAASEEDCPAVVYAYAAEASTEKACQEWPGWDPLPNPCEDSAETIDTAFTVLEAMTIPGDDAEVEVCSQSFTVPKGFEYELCNLRDEVFDQTVYAVDNESLTGPIEEAREEYLGGLDCNEDLPPEVDACELINTVTGTAWALKNEINIQQGPSAQSAEDEGEGENESVEEAAQNYEPVGESGPMDECPMPWPAFAGAQLPGCAMPPEGLSLGGLASYAESLALYCGVVCETSPSLCALIDAETLWIATVLASATESYGEYAATEAWMKAHLDREKPLLDASRNIRTFEGESGFEGNSAVNWEIEFVPEISAYTGGMVGGFDVGAAFSVFQLAGLHFDEHGTTRQDADPVAVDPGSEVTPPTRKPATAMEKAKDAAACAAALAATYFAARAAFMFTLGTGGWGFVLGAAVVIAAGTWALFACQEATDNFLDEGYIKCKARWEVWHGPQQVDTETEIGPLVMQGASEGNGTRGPVVFEETHEQEGYHQGQQVCKEMYVRVRDEAYAYYTTWAATEGNGSASLGVVLPLLEGQNTKEVLSEKITELDEDAGVYFDNVGGFLIVGCQDDICPMDLEVELNSTCGTQILTPNAEGAQYTFQAGVGCTILTLSVHGYEVAVAVPLSVNVHAEAAGPRYGG